MPSNHTSGIPDLSGACLTGNNGQKYKFLQKIDSGEFGVVYKCQDANSAADYACKVMNMDALQDCIQVILREVDILKKIKHKRLLSCHEQLCAQQFMFVFTPFIDGGTLAKLLYEEKMTFDIVGRIVYEILEGVAYLHQNNICHRDLKPNNILCTVKRPVDIVIADFGLSRTFGTDGLMSSHCGSTQYAAPEVYNSSYTAACDMWSLGAIINEMIRGPFSTKPLHSMEYDIPLPPAIHDFIGRLLQYDPKKRMTAQEALKHEWMVEIAHKFFPGDPAAAPEVEPVAVTPSSESTEMS